MNENYLKSDLLNIKWRIKRKKIIKIEILQQYIHSLKFVSFQNCFILNVIIV